MPEGEACRNLHLEVDCKKYESCFVPCASIEYIYGVTPVVMGQVGTNRTITGFIDDAYNFGFEHNDRSLPEFKEVYNYDPKDFEAVDTSGSIEPPFSDKDSGSLMEEVTVLAPTDRVQRFKQFFRLSEPRVILDTSAA